MGRIVVTACTVVGADFVSAAEKGENLDMKPQIVESFQEAVIANDLAVVDALLEQTPELADAKDERGVSFLLVALYQGHKGVAARIAAVREHLDIFEAAAVGELAAVRSLLGADPTALDTYSADGFTPLHLATFFGRFELVRFILAGGGSVEASARATKRVNCFLDMMPYLPGKWCEMPGAPRGPLELSVLYPPRRFSRAATVT